jgi:hypothetical protein
MSYIIEITEYKAEAAETYATGTDIEVITTESIHTEWGELETVEVIEAGPQGLKGDPGEPGEPGAPGPENLVVSETDPGLTEPGLWIQIFPNGDATFWVEDGS